ELADLGANGRLRAVTRLRGLGKALEPDDFEERVKLIEVHKLLTPRGLPAGFRVASGIGAMENFDTRACLDGTRCNKGFAREMCIAIKNRRLPRSGSVRWCSPEA